MPSSLPITFNSRTFALDISEIPAVAHSVTIQELINNSWDVAGLQPTGAALGSIYEPASYNDHSQMAADEIAKGGLPGFLAWITSRINAAFVSILAAGGNTGVSPTDETVYQALKTWEASVQLVVQGNTIVVTPK